MSPTSRSRTTEMSATRSSMVPPLRRWFRSISIGAASTHASSSGTPRRILPASSFATRLRSRGRRSRPGSASRPIHLRAISPRSDTSVTAPSSVDECPSTGRWQGLAAGPTAYRSRSGSQRPPQFVARPSATFCIFRMQSVEQFGSVIGTDNPDLTAFRDRGGKAIVWHGWADQLITPEGTVDYYTRVQQQMESPKKTSDFIRLFMAPGVAHCAGGAGPQPTGQLEVLRSWVEEGKAPETLLATRRDQSGTARTRPLC